MIVLFFFFQAEDGIRDLTVTGVQTCALPILSVERGASGWPQTSEQRVRTIVAPVSVAWLGAHVLYLEEFLEDDPEDPRRQLLLALEPAGTPAHAVRVRLFTFARPRHWMHLNYRPRLAARLARSEERRVGKECRSRWSA